MKARTPTHVLAFGLGALFYPTVEYVLMRYLGRSVLDPTWRKS